MTTSRVLTAVLVGVLGCVLAAGVTAGSRVDPEPPVAPGETRVEPLTVLRAWDARRAAAWQRGDADELAALYTVDSAAGRADRALLAAYAERGLRVTGLRMQRAAVEVRAAAEDRLVLVVTDRVVAARAVGPRGTVSLPRDAWSTRTVVLVRGSGGWQAAEVRGQRSPAARTAVTSRSENW